MMLSTCQLKQIKNYEVRGRGAAGGNRDYRKDGRKLAEANRELLEAKDRARTLENSLCDALSRAGVAGGRSMMGR
jgi:hypothetical protein